jgi:hypothetical protein
LNENAAPEAHTPRARKPKIRKPWYRARNIVLALVALVALVIGREVYRAVTARPGHAINYGRKMIELIESRAPRAGGDPAASANSYPLIAQLCDISEAINAEMRARPYPETDPASQIAPWDFSIEYSPNAVYTGKALEFVAEGNALIRQKYEEAGAPALLDELARRTRCIPPEQDGEIIGWLLPELGYLRNLARMNAGNMAIATRNADATAWLAAYRRMIGSGRTELQQAFLINRLVGIAIFALANQELAHDCIERHWDEPTLRAALAELDRQLALVPDIGLSMEAERLSMLDTIQWTHTDDGHGDGRLIFSATRALGAFGPSIDLPDWLHWAEEYKIINLAGIAFAGKKATTRKANEFMDLVVRFATTPAPQRSSVPNPDAMVESLSPRFALLRMMTPAIAKAVMSDDQFWTTAQGTRVLLALEIYRARSGAYPSELAALAPDILKEVPLDPVNGKPFGYALLKDDPDGRGYLLYSLGRDGIDDGGTTDKDNLPTAVSNPRKGVGLDYIINWPREKPKPPEPDEAGGAVGG